MSSSKKSSTKQKMKLVMLGEGRVGKTSLLQRFMSNTFDEEQPSTTAATMYASTKMQTDSGVTANVAIWDTAGQEKYHALGPIYYRDAHGAFIAYDITDRDSFDKVKVWLKELHQVVGDSIPIVVVGNKCDLERSRKVQAKEAEEWAVAHGAQHFLCSAKLGIKVTEAFTALVNSVADKGTAVRGGGPNGGGGKDGLSAGSAASAPVARKGGVKITLEERAPAGKEGGGGGKDGKKDGCAC
jgi:small GTP-binding protein